MRLLWHSNAPWHGSGYGVQTALHVPRLQGLGHQMAISCNWGLENGVMSWPGPVEEIICYPKGVTDDSQDILPAHARHHRADAIITLYDAWTIKPDGLQRPWVPYFPVDMEPIPERILERIKHATVRVAMSRSGQRETENAGLDCEYVPHAYDKDDYFPADGSAPRAAIGAEGKFLVGVVAANKGIPGAPHRKSFIQILQGFKLFHSANPDSVLYMHTYGRSSMGGLDLDGLVQHFGMADCVVVADPYMVHLGYPVEMMRALYSACDVLLSPSMGEGFGVPILEAQACGTPAIVGDWTAMPEVCRTGLAIPREHAYPYYWPSYETEYIVHPEAVAAALEDAMTWDHDRADVAAKVLEYEADHVCRTYWPPVLAKVEERVGEGEAMPVAKLNRQQRRAKQRQKAPA